MGKTRDKTTAKMNINRRGFLGGTAALVAGTSLGLPPSAAAQTVDVPLTGLDDTWDGPSGIGDYAKKNGNTAEVVNAAHGQIRNRKLDRRTSDAKVVDDPYDLVIVGAGISGLTAAYVFLRDRPRSRVLILDQHAIFGGEAKQNDFEVDGYRLTAPQGSTGVVVPFARAEEAGFPSVFLKELGYPEAFTFQEPQNLTQPIQVPQDMWSPMHIAWERADTAFFYEGKGLVKNPWQNGFAEAPISEKLKRALVELELFRTPPKRADWDRWLDTMTYKAFLLNVAKVPADVIEDVCAYLDPIMAAMGCGQGSDIISAYSAYNFMMPGVIGYSRYLAGGADPTDSVYLATFPGGNTFAAKRFLKLAKPNALTGGTSLLELQNSSVVWEALDRPEDNCRVRLSSTVFSVVHEGKPNKAKMVRIAYEKGGVVNAVRARAVICAGQQHVNKRICHDVSPAYRKAMEAFHHAPILVVNVALRNWKFLDRIGVAAVRWFEGLGWWTSLRRNLVLDGQETQPLDPNKPVVLTQYIPFLLPGVEFPEQCTQGRMQLFAMSFEDIAAQIRDQFTKMFGPHGFDAERDIAEIIANRQGHAYFVGPPGFFFGKDGKKPPKDILREPFHRIAFSHSELSGAQMWETAAMEGERAAKQVITLMESEPS